MSYGTDWQAEIDRHYGSADTVTGEAAALRQLLLMHSRSVARLALQLAHRNRLPLDDDDIVAAAMLHDIGIVATDAAGIHCHGSEHYLRHGVLGAAMLRADGVDEVFARIAERHTGAGITADDIAAANLPMPAGDYTPQTLLEQLICYADKFYSKSGSMERKPMERVLASLRRFGPAAEGRFRALRERFGDPQQD